VSRDVDVTRFTEPRDVYASAQPSCRSPAGEHELERRGHPRAPPSSLPSSAGVLASRPLGVGFPPPLFRAFMGLVASVLIVVVVVHNSSSQRLE
jgi:hypothetical protein